MKFYRRSDDVTADMEEMDAEGGVVGRDELPLLESCEPCEITDKNDNKATSAKATEAADSSYSWRRLLTDVDLRRPLLIACMLVVIQQFSGINAVNKIFQLHIGQIFNIIAIPLSTARAIETSLYYIVADRSCPNHRYIVIN